MEKRKSAKEIVNDFQNYLLEDGKSPKTIESYVGDIKGFVRHLASLGYEFDGEIQRFCLTNYRNHLLEKEYQAAAINKKINSLMSLNHFLINNGYMREITVSLRKDRVKVAAGSEKQVEVYSEKQQEKLLFFVLRDKARKREKAIVLILLFTGVRVSELCSIKTKNIDFLTNHLRITGKGGKVREVPLRSEVVEAIRDYLVERADHRHGQSEYLFLGQRGAIGRDAVNTILEKLTKRAAVDVRLKPHTFCTRLVSLGVPITTVSKLAGHSNIETTARFYINSSKE